MAMCGISNKKKSKINHLGSHLGNEKGEPKTSQISRRKKISEMENREVMKKITETKRGFFEKINKIKNFYQDGGIK